MLCCVERFKDRAVSNELAEGVGLRVQFGFLIYYPLLVWLHGSVFQSFIAAVCPVAANRFVEVDGFQPPFTTALDDATAYSAMMSIIALDVSSGTST